MVMKIDYRLLLFPPWYIYNLITKNKKITYKQLDFSDYYFIIWITCQWLLLFVSGENFILTIISANFAITGFLAANIYLQLDINQYSENDQKFLKSIPIKILIAVGTIAFLHLSASLPILAFNKLVIYLKGNIYASDYMWTSNYIIIGYLLIFSWFIFIIINKYRIFNIFPRSKEKVWPCKLGRLGKIYIYLFYLVIILFFLDLLIMGNLIYFV